MIVKTRTEDGFDVKVYDRNGNCFVMMFGGNWDLYWLPDYTNECTTLCFDKTDKTFYATLDKLFNDIKTNDDKYIPSLRGNTFTFISDDAPEDEANKLEIIKGDSSYTINFIKNEKESTNGAVRMGCPIRFCNAGSRVPKIKNLFMGVFGDLTQDDHEIEIEKN